MAQQPAPNTPSGPDALPGATGPDSTPASAELRIERSRFSRLLARFGLGELTDPILRPTKPSAGQASNG